MMTLDLRGKIKFYSNNSMLDRGNSDLAIEGKLYRYFDPEGKGLKASPFELQTNHQRD
jgi:hypothetical protein